MAYTALIIVHTAAALFALFAGALVLQQPRWHRPLTVAIAVMTAALPFSVALGWSDTSGATRPIFLALIVVAAAMVVRAHLAARAHQVGRRADEVGHVGFVLIALLTGFVAVAVIRADLALLPVLLCVATVPVSGSLILHRARRRIRAPETAGDTPHVSSTARSTTTWDAPPKPSPSASSSASPQTPST